MNSNDPAPRVSWPKRLFRHLLGALLWVVLAGIGIWSTLAIVYSNLPWAWLRKGAALLFAIGFIAVLVWVRPRWRARLACLAAFGIIVAWFLAIPPSNDRDWQPDLAVLAYADIDGSKVTVHNIRHCDYRTETDFDVKHYDRTYDLERLRTADLFMVYWGSPHMAHTMVSFGFEGGEYLCFSIETRKEKGEGYSAVKGLFRQFELMYVAADERDVVRLRTNYRKDEDTYLFRLKATPAQVRAFFLKYIVRMNSLRQRPEWYSAVTQNCTTSIRTQRTAAERSPWDWRMLANGHGDALLYERGVIFTNLPLAELKHQALINTRAHEAGNDADFSRRIRQGVPGIEGTPAL